ncbi:conserved hypothetical protein [Methanohalobium evestigatum Z-7303]|uniref:Uncharacterized protein n=1 Tax=Methanohalobium evestigatum (strain ATCC BAA-1072 / DSM 3721 / NBRC 107634 / OCM 161 / Z-7303) TaxID=644295 RepID=D7E9C1_METEZ|nr:hypothetical protein [Methanohalobium evestigatum]ADI74193.1 conserved hypothetical protein [Methanohalobium evestigatum Z-7303]
MAKYTYQDSTELPVQRDFIQDLQTFLDVTQKVIPLEKSAIETYNDTETRIKSLNKRINELERFEKNIKGYVEKLADDTDSEEIIEFKDAVVDTCSSYTNKWTQYLEEEIKSQKKQCENEIENIESQVYPALDPLFKGGIYGAREKYTGVVDDELRGKLTAELDGLQYESELTYEYELLSVRSIYGQLYIPFWSTSGLIHKENKVKNTDVSDYLLDSFSYNDGYLDAVFKNKKEGNSFRIMYDNNLYHIYCGDYNITEDSTLSNSLDMENIENFVSVLVDFILKNIRSQKLTSLLYVDKDAVKNNKIFDCLKNIAQQYGYIVTECLERGYVKNEITIKIHKSDGNRTEKYANINEIFNQLSSLGSEGIELAEILGIHNQDSGSSSV